MKSSFNLAAPLVLAIFFGAACAGGERQDEAAKYAAEANKISEEARALAEKTEMRSRKLFNANIQTAPQLAGYQLEMRREAESIAADYGKIAELLREVSEKFDEAARLNDSEIYKIYAENKAREFASRAAGFEARKGNLRAFVDIADPAKMSAKFEENNARFEKLMREAEAFAAVAKDLEAENKEFFRKLK